MRHPLLKLTVAALTGLGLTGFANSAFSQGRIPGGSSTTGIPGGNIGGTGLSNVVTIPGGAPPNSGFGTINSGPLLGTANGGAMGPINAVPGIGNTNGGAMGYVNAGAGLGTANGGAMGPINAVPGIGNTNGGAVGYLNAGPRIGMGGVTTAMFGTPVSRFPAHPSMFGSPPVVNSRIVTPGGSFAPPPTNGLYAPPPTNGLYAPPPTNGIYAPPPTNGIYSAQLGGSGALPQGYSAGITTSAPANSPTPGASP
jgi:hypothetical protein